MRHNRTSLALGATTFSTLALVCCGLFFIASAEGNLLAVTEAPFAGGRGAAYFVGSDRQEDDLQNVLYAGIRCEGGELLVWADQSIASADRLDAGLPYSISKRELSFPSPVCN